MNIYDAALDKLIRRAEHDAQFCADTYSGTDPRASGYINFGIPARSAAAAEPARLAEISKWCQQPRQYEGSGVLLDNTTIVTLASLLQGDKLSPLTLWDLGRAITAVVTYDNIFHFENPDVNDDELNARLDQVAFRPLTLPSVGSEHGPGGVRMLFYTTWKDTHSVMQGLEQSVGTSTMAGLEIDDLTTQWSVALGLPLEPADIVNADMSGKEWRSNGPLLLLKLWEATRTQAYAPNFESLLQQVSTAKPRSDLHEGMFDSLRRFIRESNYRGHVNERLASHLGLPYMPNVARIPFRSRFYDRAAIVSDRLPSILALDTRYSERAAQAPLLSGEPFVLPVFLALAVRDAATPEDLWSAVAELRDQARGYRERRAALDKALEQGDLNVTADTFKAVRTEAEKLTTLLGAAGRAAADPLVESVKARPIALVAGMPLDWLQTGLAVLIAGARKLLPESVRDRLMWRLSHPEYRFLSDVISQSRVITNSMPAIQRIWGLPDGETEPFRRRYEGFAGLQTRSSKQAPE